MERRPLVIVAGQVQELPQGDSVVGASDPQVSAVTQYVEPVVIGGFNDNTVYIDTVPVVPMFVMMPDGDIVTAGAFNAA
jgi:hypothetical protein